MVNSAGQQFADPLFLGDSAVLYDASEFRTALNLLSTPGRRSSLDMMITPGAGNMSISVSPGLCAVPGNVGGNLVASPALPKQGMYVAQLNAPATVSGIPANATGTARTDYVWCLLADKLVTGSGLNEAVIKIQSPGTTNPPAGYSGQRLGTLTVPAGANASTPVAPTWIGVDATLAAPPSVSTLIANALAPYAARQPTQLWNWWAPNGSSRLIPSSSWTDIFGSAKSMTFLANHLYSITSSLQVYVVSGKTGLISIQVGIWNNTSLAQRMTMQLLGQSPIEGIFPITISRIWGPTGSTYTTTIKTTAACSVANAAAVWAPDFSSPYTEVVDLGYVAPS
jgi:hypothetical protein